MFLVPPLKKQYIGRYIGDFAASVKEVLESEAKI